MTARRPSVVTPPPPVRAGAVARHSGSLAPTAPRVAAPGPPTSSGGVAGGGAGAGAGSGSPAGGGHAPGSGGGSTPAPGGGSSAPGPPGSPGSPGSPGAPGAGTGDTSPPGPPPTLTDRVIGVASGVTSELPSPAGPVATKVLNQAGATLDKLVPAPPGGG